MVAFEWASGLKRPKAGQGMLALVQSAKRRLVVQTPEVAETDQDFTEVCRRVFARTQQPSTAGAETLFVASRTDKGVRRPAPRCLQSATVAALQERDSDYARVMAVPHHMSTLACPAPARPTVAMISLPSSSESDRQALSNDGWLNTTGTVLHFAAICGRYNLCLLCSLKLFAATPWPKRRGLPNCPPPTRKRRASRVGMSLVAASTHGQTATILGRKAPIARTCQSNPAKSASKSEPPTTSVTPHYTPTIRARRLVLHHHHHHVCLSPAIDALNCWSSPVPRLCPRLGQSWRQAS